MMKDTYGHLRKEILSLEEIKRQLKGDFEEGEIQKFLTDMTENGEMSVTTTNSQRYYEFTS